MSATPSPTSSPSSSPLQKRKGSRVQRACFNCRKRKQGCDEERPCKRCIEKGIECVEAEPKRKKGKSKEELSMTFIDTTAIREPPEISSEDESSDGSFELGSSDFDSPRNERKSNSPASGRASPVTHISLPSLPLSSNLISIPTSSKPREDIARNVYLQRLSPKQERFRSAMSKLRSEREKKSSPSLKGMSLALLLPFLGNIQEMLSDHLDFDAITFGKEETIESNESTVDTTLPSLHHLSFSNSATTSINTRLDNSPITYIKDCWREILHSAKYDENLKREFNQIKENWKEITNALRRMEWQKVQSLLRELDPQTTWNGEVAPAVMFWSPGGRIHHATDKLCRMLGYTLEELQVQASLDGGKSQIRVHTLLHPDDMVPILARQLEESLTTSTSSMYHTKTRLMSKAGEEIAVCASIANLQDQTGYLLLTIAHFAPLSSFHYS